MRLSTRPLTILARGAASSSHSWLYKAGTRAVLNVSGPEVVADHGREQDGVQSVERAAVRAEDPAGVLRVGLALDERLEQVAHRRHESDAQAQHQRLGAGQPVLIAPGHPDPEDGAEHPYDEAL